MFYTQGGQNIVITCYTVTGIDDSKYFKDQFTDKLCDDSELYHSTLCCVVPLLLLQTMRVIRLAPLLFTSNFHLQFHFSLEVFWLKCNSLKIRDIFV